MPSGKSAKSNKKPIEQYDHKGKKRANNPPVGLVTPQTDPPDPPKKSYAYDPHLDPQLVWAGKAERMSFEVPTVSLHVHERIDPRTIIEAVRKRNGTVAAMSSSPSVGAMSSPPDRSHSNFAGQRPALQMPLFETREENPPLREAIDFYRHPHNWSNRLIAGETLRQSEWRDVLLKGGVRGQGGQTIEFSRVEPLGGTRWLHADAETIPVAAVSPPPPGGRRPPLQPSGGGIDPPLQRVVISFGPEYAPLEQRQVELAWEEARQLSPRPSILLFVYTDIDPEAGKDIAELTPAEAGMIFLAAKIDADVWTKDLKKKARTSPSVWLVGQPDVELRRVAVAAVSDRRPAVSPPPSRGAERVGGQRPPLQEMYHVEVRGLITSTPRQG